ncbi:Helicase conserved C-terminal domain-containing protein [Jiangella alba]|uniref:Helicase conserved C-terminal domain-containing protein n=2 Tax=Jiangella alba TaxID=561176 RepID=A0A1H5PSQ3_9ACTN|nr:Helicase conserved C-terminal domain-containing protein [Jiangella alba]
MPNVVLWANGPVAGRLSVAAASVVGMWPGIQANDEAGLRKVVDPSTFVRGLMYAQHGAVTNVEWGTGEGLLTGRVAGSARRPYSTVAVLKQAGAGQYTFVEGRCNCPVGFDCKHVVALVVTALSGGEPGRGPAGEAKALDWQRSLDSLLGDGTPAPNRDPRAAIAVELTLSSKPRATGRWDDAAGTRPRVLARLVRPGRGGWVAGDLSWSRLRLRPELVAGPIEQLRWLRQFFLLYEAGRSDTTYSPYGRDEKHLDLTAFESGQLWALLDEAARLGVRFVRGKKGGDVDGYRAARVSLDVTEDEAGGLEVVPLLTVDGEDDEVAPVRFIGDDGHGVVYAPRADVDATTNVQAWRFGLAKLDHPAGRELQQLVLDDVRLTVPATDFGRFRDEYVPRLRRLAAVESSDGSFEPPEISGPTLVARATYGDGHGLELDWEWQYQIGEAARRVPLGEPAPDGVGDGFRDGAAERALLAGLDPGLLGSAGRAGQRRRFDGLDTMRFSTEALPRLRDLDDVEVEVTGEPADYREVGDSLVVGVSAEESQGETDWFDLGVTITADGRDVPFTDVFTALARDEPYLLLSDGGYFSLEKPELQSLRRLMDEARALGDGAGDGTRISRFQAGLWDELAALGVVTHQADSWQRQVQGLLALADLDDDAVPPATLRAQLRPYQLDGYRWLTFLWEHRLGGILADDMGLGKTLQALALFCHAKQTDADLPPFLVVAPTSVVSNWVTEAARFAPGLTVVPVTDTLRRRGRPIEDVVAGADVVVTTYTLLRLDADAYAQVTWSGLVLDEAQHVKNHQSKTYQAARRLPAPVKLAVTGTPVENNLMELWSQLSIAAPGLFPHPGRFEEYYGKPIERQGDAERLAQFRRRIKPLVLRRTKEQVAADLPEKQEQVLEVDLHPKHRKVYDKYLQRERQRILGLLDDVDKNRFTILRSLTLLRQLSLHAGLVDDAHGGLASAKIELLIEQLGDVIDGGHRALVFSQFTGFLGLVRERLEAAGIEYCYLDGATRRRDEVIGRFKEGTAPVFLISLKAGGFGLNLTEADYCFILDPWWNPATEAQAVDRTHRIGQTRNVMVYRLIAADTIEQKVMALKDRKAKLAASVMDDGNAFGNRLGVDDIRQLLE